MPDVWLTSPRPRFRIAALDLAIRLALLVAVLASVACEREPRPLRIFLITIDTLRPDHLSMYGYARDTDAPLRWLADDGVVFRNAYSSAPWTAPALASLLTSTHPWAHGVRGGSVRGFHEGQPKVHHQEVLRDGLSTLAERLAAAGFDTIAVSSTPHARPELGFAQGFATFEALLPTNPRPKRGEVYADAHAVRRALDRFTPRLRNAKRAFIWVHWLDPHHPYLGRAPWVGEYRAEGGAERVLQPRRRAAGPDADVARESVVPLYDSEVRFVTEALGGWLADVGIGDDDLVILTSDHGEAFYEHGYWGHSTWMYDTELRVPLIFRFPARSGVPRSGRIDVPVSLLDVMPTVLDVAGLPAEGLEGASLLSLSRRGSEALAERPIHAEHWRHGNRLRAVRLGRFKLIFDERSGREELFDLEADPGELTNLAADASGAARFALARLRDALRMQQIAASTAPSAGRRAIDPEVERSLQALGYIE